MQGSSRYRHFHPVETVNFQINRWLADADEDELVAATSRCASLAELKREMLALAARAESEGRALHASTYYRGAEFFMAFSDPDKMPAYEKFISLFYNGFQVPMEHHRIPFEGASLPAVRFRAEGGRRDTLVIHGGFDSYMEEFFSWASTFTSMGCDVVLFEGPGQGAAIRRFGLTMGHDWERPVGAVLDHFGVKACTLMGISLGGYLAPRAAAFEPRVKRVIAHNILTDFYDCFASRGGSHLFRAIDRAAVEGRAADVNARIERLIATNEANGWAITHGMHISGSPSPSVYLDWLRKLRTAPFSFRIKQDVLLTAGTDDHIVPLEQFFEQGKTLTNAQSVTMRLFTEYEGCASHCQNGNKALLLAFVGNWLDFHLSKRDCYVTATEVPDIEIIT